MWWAWLAGIGGGVLLLLAVCLCCRPRAVPRECEVLVIGSGAAGLAAAVASGDRDVVVLEAARSVGGTTARSGGALWIPDNDWKRARGGAETRGQFMEYARARNGRPLTALETKRADAFFHGAREAAAELVAAGVRLRPSKVSALARDANARYAKSVGLDADAELLNTHCDYGTERNRSALGRTLFVPPEFEVASILTVIRETSLGSLLRYLPSLLRSGAFNNGRGGDLVIALRKAVRRKCPRCKIITSARVVDLAPEDTKWRATLADGRSVVAPRVIVATGGAGALVEAARRAARFDAVRGSCSVPTARGDLAGGRVGAASAPAVWFKQCILKSPDVEYELGGNIAGWFLSGSSAFLVDARGRRFVNEASGYPIRGRTQANTNRKVVAYVGDAHARNAYTAFDAPGGAWPPRGASTKRLIRADTWAELSRRVGEEMLAHDPDVDLGEFARGMEVTRRRFDRMAAAGVDEDFRRGESASDFSWVKALGADVDRANPLLRPLDDGGPYYALLMGAAVLDTTGGIVTDEHARALDERGRPLPGLYAAGNAAVPVLDAAVYLSGGFTIAHAVWSGWVAGKHEDA